MKITEKEFLEKVEQHKGILLKVSRIYCSHPEDRKDLFQEIILQMWQSVKRFNQNCQFSTWMYQVAINTALVIHKSEKRRPDSIPLSTNDAYAQEPYQHKHEKQLATFYLACESLNKVEKAVILLYIEGYSSEQIAETLGIRSVNARVKISRIKSKLQNTIEAQNYEF